MKTRWTKMWWRRWQWKWSSLLIVLILVSAAAGQAYRQYCSQCSSGGDTSGCISSTPNPDCPNQNCSGTGCTDCVCDKSVDGQSCYCYIIIV